MGAPRSALFVTVTTLTLVSLAAVAACGGGGSPSRGSPDGAPSGSDATDDAPGVTLEAGAADTATPLRDSGTAPSDASSAPDSARDSGFPEATHLSLTVPDNGGPVIAHPTLVTITFAGDSERSFAEALGSYLVTSPWLAAVGPEYGIGLGTHAAVELAQSAPGTIDDTTIQALIASLILDQTAPAPSGGSTIPVEPGSPFDADDGGFPFDGGVASSDGGATAVLLPAIYMIYIPSTTRETVDGLDLCTYSGGGYHSMALGSFDGMTFAYAVVSSCPQLPASEIQQSVSHEFIEAATDPAGTAPAWSIQDQTSVWSYFGGEVGDLCSFVGPQWAEGGYTQLQRVYSNASANAGGDPCLPATGPYYAADVEPQTWVGVAAGASTTFSVVGWSTAAVPTWALSSQPYISSPDTFSPGMSLSGGALNNGQTATLTVSVPAGTASDSFAMVLVGSADSMTSYQYSLVGIYVP